MANETTKNERTDGFPTDDNAATGALNPNARKKMEEENAVMPGSPETADLTRGHGRRPAHPDGEKRDPQQRDSADEVPKGPTP